MSRTIANVALVGFMGTGKSTVGRITAELLRFRIFDTDDWIEQQAKKPITTIFAQEGEPAFRRWESAAVESLNGVSNLVISTGGGLVTVENTMVRLKEMALVICLWASPEAIWERVRGQSHRPLLLTDDPLRKIQDLLNEREPAYRSADVLINTEQRSVREVAQQVALQFNMARAQNR